MIAGAFQKNKVKGKVVVIDPNPAPLVKAKGFSVTVSNVNGNGQPTGTVVDQDPAAYSSKPAGTTVTIFVAQ